MPGPWPAPCATASRCSRYSLRSIPRASARYAATPSPRIADLDPDVADGSSALEALPGERVEPPAPAARLDVLGEFFDLVLTEMLPYHRRFAHRWDEYRFSNRARLEHAEQRAMTAEEYVASQNGRAEDTADWLDWFAEHRIDAVVEPTIPIVAPSAAAATRSRSVTSTTSR